MRLPIGCQDNSSAPEAAAVELEEPAELPEIETLVTEFAIATDPDINYEDMNEEPEQTDEIEFVRLTPGNYDSSFFRDSLEMETRNM